MIQLVPLNQSQYQLEMERLKEEFAQDLVQSGEYTLEEARERTYQDILKLLPQGLETPGQHLFAVLESDGGAKVGMVWYGVLQTLKRPFAFIYDIRIDDEYQRKGFGRQALLAIEQHARNQGLDRISLHVFGHNTGAQTLYTQLGYDITDINMSKPIV